MIEKNTEIKNKQPKKGVDRINSDNIYIYMHNTYTCTQLAEAGANVADVCPAGARPGRMGCNWLP